MFDESRLNGKQKEELEKYKQLYRLANEKLAELDSKLEKLEKIAKSTPNYDTVIKCLKMIEDVEPRLYANKYAGTSYNDVVHDRTHLVGTVVRHDITEETVSSPIMEPDYETRDKAKKVIEKCNKKLAQIENLEQCLELKERIEDCLHEDLEVDKSLHAIENICFSDYNFDIKEYSEKVGIKPNDKYTMDDLEEFNFSRNFEGYYYWDWWEYQ